MSSKSSVVNLYDVLTGGKRLQAKVSSDRADLVIETLPITITGTSGRASAKTSQVTNKKNEIK